MHRQSGESRQLQDEGCSRPPTDKKLTQQEYTELETFLLLSQYWAFVIGQL